jgi:hypothetical protein
MQNPLQQPSLMPAVVPAGHRGGARLHRRDPDIAHDPAVLRVTRSWLVVVSGFEAQPTKTTDANVTNSVLMNPGGSKRCARSNHAATRALITDFRRSVGKTCVGLSQQTNEWQLP